MNQTENPNKKDKTFLVLSRYVGERIFVGDNIEIIVTDISCDNFNNKVKIGISAPPEVSILRDDAKITFKKEKKHEQR
jgi:carbon storage regulator CsrA